MNIDNAFPSNYLKAADLGGKRVPVTIDRVEMEKLGEDNKAIVYFVSKAKGLVLNVTNKNMIVEICGSAETDDWAGKKIMLYSCKVDFQGKRTDAIRVDYPADAVQKPPVATAEDEPSF